MEKLEKLEQAYYKAKLAYLTELEEHIEYAEAAVEQADECLRETQLSWFMGMGNNDNWQYTAPQRKELAKARIRFKELVVKYKALKLSTPLPEPAPVLMKEEDLPF